MGLFQRSSQRSQHQQTSSHSSSVERHPEQENKTPASGSVGSSKKRRLLGGLIRGRTPERNRNPLPPSSHGHKPLAEALSPPQIQNLPIPVQHQALASRSQHELRQRLQEAQKVETFLSQANTFKPTIGGSDIEFLFNHVTTPTTAERDGMPSRSDTSKKVTAGMSIKEIREARKNGERVRQRIHRKEQGSQPKEDLSRGATTRSAQSITMAGGSNNPQSIFHPSPQHLAKLQQQQHLSSKARRHAKEVHTTDDTATAIQSHSHQSVSSYSHASSTHHHPRSDNPAAPPRGGHQMQSWMENNTDVSSLDNNTKRLLKGRAKKGKKGILGSSRTDLAAFESEETYYEAMRVLEEGKKFQNVSKAFIQHFNANQSENQDSKSQAPSMKRSRSAPKESHQQRDETFASTPPSHSKTMDDLISHSGKSMATNNRSLASSSLAAPLKGILRNSKYGGSASIKSRHTLQDSILETDERREGFDSTTNELHPSNSDEDNGSFDVYTSNSSDEMFIGIRPSSSSESAGLYTDENELIELRACLNSRDEGDQAVGEGVLNETNDSLYDQGSREVSGQHELQNPGDQVDEPETVEPLAANDDQQVEANEFQQRESKRTTSLISPAEQHSSTATKDVGLQESASDNSDGLKFIQNKFADMISSVGTFHEKQNQKLEEMRKSFISSLSAGSSSHTEDHAGYSCDQEGETAQAQGNFNDRSKQDDLYRQMMNANGEAVENAAINLIRERSSLSAKPAESTGIVNLAISTETADTTEHRATPDRDNHPRREISMPFEKPSALENASILRRKRSTTLEKASERGSATNILKEQSTLLVEPSERANVAKSIELFQNKTVCHRAETRNHLSQPQHKAESQAGPLRQNEGTFQTSCNENEKLSLEGDDPSLAEVMDLALSTSSGEKIDNLKQYWESQRGGGKPVAVGKGAPQAETVAGSRMGLVIRASKEQPDGPDQSTNVRQDVQDQYSEEKPVVQGKCAPQSVSTSVAGDRMGLVLPATKRETDGPDQNAKCRQRVPDRYSRDKELLDEPPDLGKSASIPDEEGGNMDGVVFSIASADDSLARDNTMITRTMATYDEGTSSRSIYDGPIASSKSSFSMARSRHLSLIDSALSEDDTVSTVTADLMHGAKIHKSGEEQISSLLSRLDHIEQTNKIPSQEKDESVDRTVADEISEIKSILQGLKAQTSRRINPRDPPPDDSRMSRDAPDARDAPGISRRDAPDSFDQHHSSGSSTASAGYIKRTLGLEPAEMLRRISPRKPATDATKPVKPDCSASAPSYMPERTSAHVTNRDGALGSQNGPSAAKRRTQIFGGDRSTQGSVEWPQSHGNGFSVSSGFEQVTSGNARHHGSLMGNFSLLKGVEQNSPEFGRVVEHRTASHFGNHGGYSGPNGATLLVGMPGNSVVGYGSQIKGSSYSQLSGARHQSPSPNQTEQQQYSSRAGQLYDPHRVDTPHRFNHHPIGASYQSHRALHHTTMAPAQHPVEELYYSRTESDLTTSIVFEESHPKERDSSISRQHKSNRAATYFNTLSAGVKTVGSFDSVSGRYSGTTNSKKSGGSVDSQTKTLSIDSRTLDATIDSISASRSPASKDDDTRDTLPSTEKGFRSQIFRSAKTHITKMGKSGHISEPFKARVLRVMDPLVGKSSSDDESSVQEEAEAEETRSPPNKGYLPACHFFCG